MKKELQDKLFEKYPKIFGDRNKSPQETCMCWGIEAGDGWYWLIDNLCATIQNYIDYNNKEQIVAVQVKEKFGGLRFYVMNSDSLVDGMIWFAESLSCKICEDCGTTEGVYQTKGWVHTTCNKCEEARVAHR